MGLSEMLEKSSPIQIKRKKENASAFKSLANRNTELVDENKELKEEIERLNNIINELENIIDIEMNKMGYAKYDSCLMLMKMKIKELKGSE